MDIHGKLQPVSFSYISWLCCNIAMIDRLSKLQPVFSYIFFSVIVFFQALISVAGPRFICRPPLLCGMVTFLIKSVLLDVNLVERSVTVYSFWKKKAKKCMKGRRYGLNQWWQGRADDVIWSGCPETIWRVLISSHIVLMRFFGYRRQRLFLSWSWGLKIAGSKWECIQTPLGVFWGSG